jgi:hypothetical protein
MGLGFPRPLSVGALVKFKRVVAVGVEYGFLPRVRMLGGEGSMKAAAADLRVFPFRGAFFVGVRGGRQWLDVKASMGADSLGTFSEAMEASTWFVNPRLGFLHTFESGITVGIDAGVQVPIAPSYAQSGNTSGAATTGAGQTFKTIASVLGNKTTATVDLLRLGFLF